MIPMTKEAQLSSLLSYTCLGCSKSTSYRYVLSISGVGGCHPVFLALWTGNTNLVPASEHQRRKEKGSVQKKDKPVHTCDKITAIFFIGGRTSVDPHAMKRLFLDPLQFLNRLHLQVTRLHNRSALARFHQASRLSSAYHLSQSECP